MIMSITIHHVSDLDLPLTIFKFKEKMDKLQMVLTACREGFIRAAKGVKEQSVLDNKEFPSAAFFGRFDEQEIGFCMVNLHMPNDAHKDLEAQRIRQVARNTETESVVMVLDAYTWKIPNDIVDLYPNWATFHTMWCSLDASTRDNISEKIEAVRITADFSFCNETWFWSIPYTIDNGTVIWDDVDEFSDASSSGRFVNFFDHERQAQKIHAERS